MNNREFVWIGLAHSHQYVCNLHIINENYHKNNCLIDTRSNT